MKNIYKIKKTTGTASLPLTLRLNTVVTRRKLLGIEFRSRI
jgi:hypothetical protein